MLDLAVNHTQKAQWDVELDHEGVHHHQVTQSHAAVHHALGGAPQHGDQSGGDDELLPGVEHTQSRLAFDRGAAIALQVLVVALGFERLVVEVFDGFKIQQRVDGAALRV